MTKQYKLTITMVLDEDSDLLDCLRCDDRKSSRIIMSEDAGDQVRDDLLVCGMGKAHYEFGSTDTVWHLAEVQAVHLSSLAEFNAKRKLVYSDPAMPKKNGIACPNCGNELEDMEPMATLTSILPKKSVYCTACDYRGYRVD